MLAVILQWPTSQLKGAWECTSTICTQSTQTPWTIRWVCIFVSRGGTHVYPLTTRVERCRKSGFQQTTSIGYSCRMFSSGMRSNLPLARWLLVINCSILIVPAMFGTSKKLRYLLLPNKTAEISIRHTVMSTSIWKFWLHNGYDVSFLVGAASGHWSQYTASELQSKGHHIVWLLTELHCRSLSMSGETFTTGEGCWLLPDTVLYTQHSDRHSVMATFLPQHSKGGDTFHLWYYSCTDYDN